MENTIFHLQSLLNVKSKNLRKNNLFGLREREVEESTYDSYEGKGREGKGSYLFAIVFVSQEGKESNVYFLLFGLKIYTHM